jgi:hypothetical protein
MGKKIYRIRQSHESNPEYVTYYDPQGHFLGGKGSARPDADQPS